MNYLAHMYLSFHDDDVMVGNFIADAVKGKRMERYQAGIQKGIVLHREIDTFTDRHPLVAEARKQLHPYFHKYSGVVMDMYYDHFLARYWPDYSPEDLPSFVHNNYRILISRFAILPARIRRILPYMVRNDWLSSYADLEHLDMAFNGMAKRTSFPSGMELATLRLREHYPYFRDGFRTFFPQLIEHVRLTEIRPVRAIG